MIHLLDFLTQLFDKGLSYSAINTAKSAVVTMVSTCTGRHMDQSSGIIAKFMRGIYAQRPALPRYNNTWSVAQVLKYLAGQSPPEAISLLALARKLVMLLLLLSGQRGQSIHTLDIRNIECTGEKLILKFGELLKTSRPGHHLAEIVLPAYVDKPELCVVNTFCVYLKRTQPVRNNQHQLFLATVKPYKAVTRDTIRNWAKAVLGAAGVDLNIYGPHSTRSAATSAAAAHKIPLQTIIRTAGWDKESTFRRFYSRPVTRDTTFADCILSQN